MFTIEGYDYEFRVKELNAIEVLAFRTQLDFENVEAAQKFFNEVLRRIEVKAGENWIACEENGIYYPAGLDKDTYLTQELISYFMKNFIKPVFPKSNESKDK